MYEAMACARPIILAVDGEACRIAIQEAGAAMYAEPENPASIAKIIMYLSQHPLEANALGQHGRFFVEQHFDRKQLAENLHQHIMALLQRHNTVKSADLEASDTCTVIPTMPTKQPESSHETSDRSSAV
jgi:glycosyltransferase involved in cell wall biosynthesis